jgi:glyoxylase-like metal-dependent hydrolase (beta-lactamase superfamily II)
MYKRHFVAPLSLLVVATAAWLGGAGPGGKQPAVWVEVAPGLLRTAGMPFGYALLNGDRALLVGAPRTAVDALPSGVRKIDAVLLTHHHRDVCVAAERFLAAGVPVRAPKASAEWLTPEGVRKHWKESLPLRGSRTAYQVVPAGFPGIDCSLVDGQEINWQDWTIRVVATPGAAHDHFAYVARKGKDAPPIIFCGDALAAPAKLWAPFTTDWDHWTDAGLSKAASSLRQLAEWKPARLLPAHGPVIDRDCAAALTRTAAAVEEVGFLKSFERYTKNRLGNAPGYRFLAQEQATSNGSLPWSRVAEHLFVTGNTFVLTSKDNACLVVDPWDRRSADQIAKLRKDRSLGPVEVVLFSHAHYDHYDGIYHLPDREKFEVWTLDLVALPIADPFLLRAPFVDARPVKIDRRPKDGDTLTWREYRFRFHHLPGQSEFTMGVETVIDGKKCFFTADNFFHQDMFSGSGGWMGLNRSYPPLYGASAQKVLDAAPDWVLAEHGGPFEFNAEDFRRRVRWGAAAAAAADAICPSGNHRRDWDPHRVHVEPVLQKAKAGAALRWTLAASNPLPRPERLTVVLEGRGLTADQTWEVEMTGGATSRREFTVQLGQTIAPGRHAFALRITGPDGPDGSDAFLVAEVLP